MLRLPGVFEEYQCLHCGLIRLAPRLTQKQLKRYYPSTNYYSYKANQKPGFFWRIRTYLISHLYRPTFLSRLLSIVIQVPAMPSMAPGKILDVGCGSGDTLSQLKAVGWDTYGMDIDKRAIEIAHKRGLANVTFGGYKDIKKYKNNSFDAIRLYHVIEHLDKPQDFFALAYQKLKPGGELILGTPNGDSVVAKIAKSYWYNLDCPRHLFIFSPHTLTKLAKAHGFKKPSIEFCSAGGWVGSIQHKVREWNGSAINLVDRGWLILLFYPLEWILDRCKMGDIFVLRLRK
jgi:2-polyprenyl-3-methyl-5-hydroxy-6-metoxy-1,4-benzoquinol methylase